MRNSGLVGAILLALGAVMLYFGVNAADAPVEELTETLTGRYSDRTMTYLIGGAACGIAGLFLLIRGR